LVVEMLFDVPMPKRMTVTGPRTFSGATAEIENRTGAIQVRVDIAPARINLIRVLRWRKRALLVATERKFDTEVCQPGCEFSLPFSPVPTRNPRMIGESEVSYI
jgi:hypothetical protein